ncbi:MAG TPA: AGE family epimerase/isomerase [Thermoanaerobaculia bacterium]|nr:AGE family epimerase/isomerase [Thermoanaerobaculia bacterium]
MTPETALTEPLSAGAATDESPAALADELDVYLDRHVVAPRFPAAIDAEGWGFRARFDERWQPLPETSRFLVYQARLAWTAAHLLERRPASTELLAPAARHGLATLERMWDGEAGGFFHRLRTSGRPEPASAEKHLYSQAFALLALAALARAPGDDADRARALELARRSFAWIEGALRGDARAGYRGTVARDGSPLAFDPDAVAPPANAFGGPAGWHDANSHLHLVEAYTELERSAPRPESAAALARLVDLFLDRFYAEPGCLHLHLDAELRPVPGIVSYGHDIEAAWLLYDAALVLGRERDAELRRKVRRLAEHALAFGWDPHLEVWTERGSALARSADLTCGWWVAFEALHTLVGFAELFPERRRPFERAARDTWSFIRRRLTDTEAPGIWAGYDARGHLKREKSGDWFATYHAARSLAGSADRLRRISAAPR